MSALTVTAALITGAGRLEYRDFEEAPPAPGCVSVAVTLCGICGTEISSYRTGAGHSPAVCGHEWVGVVSAVGSGVTSVSEGERVVIAVSPPCGQCLECRSGMTEFCSLALAMARGRDANAPAHGAFARSLTVDARRVIAPPDALSDIAAAQVEPASVAFHGVRRSRILPGDTVVIQGGGSIGLLAMQFARAIGAGRTVVVEPSESRRALALRLGASLALAPGAEADALIRESTGGLGADVVFECVGRPELIQQAVSLTRRGGVMLMLGYAAAEATFNPAHWLAKEVSVVGSVAFTHDDVVRAMSLMADGRVQVEPLYSRTVALPDLGATLADLAGGTSSDLKVLVDPGLQV